MFTEHLTAEIIFQIMIVVSLIIGWTAKTVADSIRHAEHTMLKADNWTVYSQNAIMITTIIAGVYIISLFWRLIIDGVL
jgi:hypothetical protein